MRMDSDSERSLAGGTNSNKYSGALVGGAVPPPRQGSRGSVAIEGPLCVRGGCGYAYRVRASSLTSSILTIAEELRPSCATRFVVIKRGKKCRTPAAGDRGGPGNCTPQSLSGDPVSE
eukprot:GHVU01154783.1.p1 GENE.GHVU01154783.1~~GHVU01154783.1.p1  ORF type:complete len:118 (+),score=7.49 GHVU01154783.1:72-425(+)